MTNLTQSPQELIELFSNSTLENLTLAMNRLEKTISYEQNYILAHGEQNDLNSDSHWESYKIEASDNLIIWDAMKVARDTLKE